MIFALGFKAYTDMECTEYEIAYTPLWFVDYCIVV
jgi:hypothetical protein